MNQSTIILMGDVISSSQLDSSRVQKELAGAVSAVQKRFEAKRLVDIKDERKEPILSPLTITLGDEFQGVVSGLPTAVEILFAFEEHRISHQSSITLQFVTYVGGIDTPINPERAHGMLGPGLTEAREMLTDKSRDRPRFQFGSWSSSNSGSVEYRPPPIPTAEDYRWQNVPPNLFKHDRKKWSFLLTDFQLMQLVGIFRMVERLTAHWKPKDFPLIASMIEYPRDDTKVGELHNKNRSQIWKRRRTLRIEDYLTLKAQATALAALEIE